MLNRQNNHQHSSLPPSPKLNKHRNSMPKLSPTSPALTIVSSADDDEESPMMSPVDNGRKSARNALSQPQSPGLRVSFDEGDSRGHDTETITVPTTDSHRSESAVSEESCDPAVFISDNYVREDQVRQMSPNMKMMNGTR